MKRRVMARDICSSGRSTPELMRGGSSRTAGQKIHAKTNCGKMLSALAGRQLAEGENFRLSDYVSKRYTIVVATGANGGTRVETVAPLPPQ